MTISIHKARDIVEQGGVIAYPTEAVYGLGCDPFNELALAKICRIKKRSKDKGFIVLINHYEQLPLFVENDKINSLMPVLKSKWPGPVTFLLPKHQALSKLLTGDSRKIAIRMSAHPVASALSDLKPIVSTSANISQYNPCLTIEDIRRTFPVGIDGIVAGRLGKALKPTSIIDIESNTVIRE